MLQTQIFNYTQDLDKFAYKIERIIKNFRYLNSSVDI